MSSFSFMKNLFQGSIPETNLHHFPFFTTNRENDFKQMFDAIQAWLTEHVDSMKFDDEKSLPASFIQGLRDMGLFGLIIPEAFGGSELTQTLYTRTVELLNMHDTSVSLTVGAHQSIGLKGLYLFGTLEQKKYYMPKLATGELIAAFALTEPGAGSDAAGIKTRIEKKDDHYILNGSKLWITNGGHADFFTVFAKEKIGDEDKITAIMVTRDMGGVSHGPEEQKLGIKASSTVEMNFKDTKVPLSNVLGKSGEGFKIAMAVLNQGRLGLAGGALGACRVTLEDSIKYAKNRKAFGASLSEFGLIQEMITTMTCEIYTLESMTYFTTNLVDMGDTDYSIEAAICKVYATESACRVLDIGMQLHGGNGYMKDYGLERRYRDGRIAPIFEGTNEILRLFIALTGLKELSSEYKKIGQDINAIKNFDSFSSVIAKIGVVSEFAFNKVKKNVLSERLEGFHPSLSKETDRLISATKSLAVVSDKLIRQYGQKLVDEQIQLARLAAIAIDTYIIATVLCRVNSVLEKGAGPDKNTDELVIAKLVIRNARARIHQSVYDIGNNRDFETKAIAKQVIEKEKYSFHIANVKY